MGKRRRERSKEKKKRIWIVSSSLRARLFMGSHRHSKKSRSKVMMKAKLEVEVPQNPNASCSFRSWSDLPEHLLLSIVDRISFSIPDLLSFSSVSRHFRSAAATAVADGGGRPPLLLNPVVSPSTRLHIVRWSHPPRCRLQTLAPGSTKPYRSPISSRTLSKLCIGYSNSHLIFIDISANFALLANVFTGREICSPNFPSGSFLFRFGILTAPLMSSSSCSVLLVAQHDTGYSILCWRPSGSDDEERWSVLDMKNSPDIVSLIVFKGQIFALDALCRIIVVELGPIMTWRLLHAQLCIGRFVHCHSGIFRQHFIECNGELLVVLFVPAGEPLWVSGATKIVVYKLDLEKLTWVEKEDLGDWCLFVNAVGICGFSNENPSRWGGRKNCLYIAGPGYDGWSVFPLDGEAFDTTDAETPLCSWYLKSPRWPSPVWVYPSSLGFCFPQLCTNRTCIGVPYDLFVITTFLPVGGNMVYNSFLVVCHPITN